MQAKENSATHMLNYDVLSEIFNYDDKLAYTCKYYYFCYHDWLQTHRGRVKTLDDVFYALNSNRMPFEKITQITSHLGITEFDIQFTTKFIDYAGPDAVHGFLQLHHKL